MAESWGRYPQTRSDERALWWPKDARADAVEGSRLAHGLGRSYGDSCLNDGGALLHTRALDRFLAFDEQTGVLRAESGVSLDEILRIFVPRGWFVPVTPGTRFVTLGGAIANDVHGKNHHRAGTFGCHVPRFELLRSDGQRLVCSASENGELYRATIGGLGLTGIITWAEVQLVRIPSSFIDAESIRFPNLDAFFELSRETDATHEFHVSWVDCLARGNRLGRGLMSRGNWSEAHEGEVPRAHKPGGPVIPLDFPSFALNTLSVRAFNAVYYRKQLRTRVASRMHYAPFFYPLDGIRRWNRMYGKRGFFQHQSVVPEGEAVRDMMRTIARSGQGSFLAVLKTFGDIPSPGMMSFPRPGITLALDFPNKGERTMRLMDALDDIVRGAEGAVYPAKDARMSPETFRASFPRWQEFAKHVDPAFSSSFWRRVMQPGKEATK